MASRSSAEVEQIRDRIDLQDYISRSIKLDRHGDHLKGCCEFHGEKTPSFHVWHDHYKCFGCGRSGDIFTYYQEKNSVAFRTALIELAGECGISLRDDPESIKRHEAHKQTVSLYRAVAEHFHSALTDEAREYLHGRGYSDEFIDDYLIGFAPGHGHVKRTPNVTLADLQEAGLINEKGNDVLWQRIIIPIWGRYDDEIIGLAGRAWPNVDAKPKYMSIPSDAAPLLNERGLRASSGRRQDGSRYVYLAEGDTDTATIWQYQRPVVGVRGANGLQETFSALFAKIDIVYVVADGDKAGLELIQKAGGMLGSRARIITLPVDEDASSFVQKKGIEALDALAHTSKPYLEWLLDRLPTDIIPAEIDRYVEEFAAALAGTGAASQEAYTKMVAKRLGISVAPIRAAVKALTIKQEAAPTTASAPDDDVIWDVIPTINPAQALVDETMYTTIFLDKRSTDAEGIEHYTRTPFMVTSNKERFEITEAEMWRRGLRVATTKMPSAGVSNVRWRPTSPDSHSIRAYLDGKSEVSPYGLYREINTYFRQYLYYPAEAYYDFLTCWLMGTYFFTLFPSYPYVHLTGMKSAGKTTTLDVVGGLAFNALNMTSISTASIFRIIESTSPTLLIDEAEHLQKRGNDESQDDKLEILKSGYKAGAKVIRCVGDQFVPTAFDVYSPKIFGSIGNIDRILADRMISLILEKKPADVTLAEFRESVADLDFRVTRDKLHCMMLDYGAEVAERIKIGIGWDGVRDRDRELWAPILTIAEMIDDYAVKETGKPAIPNRLISRMQEMALGSVADRLIRDRNESTELLMLEGVLAYMDSHQPWAGDDWYNAQPMTTWLVENHDGLGWLKTSKQVYDALEKARAIDKRTDLMPVKQKGSRKPARCLRLRKDKLSDRFNFYAQPNDKIIPLFSDGR